MLLWETLLPKHFLDISSILKKSPTDANRDRSRSRMSGGSGKNRGQTRRVKYNDRREWTDVWLTINEHGSIWVTMWDPRHLLSRSKICFFRSCTLFTCTEFGIMGVENGFRSFKGCQVICVYFERALREWARIWRKVRIYTFSYSLSLSFLFQAPWMGPFDPVWKSRGTKTRPLYLPRPAPSECGWTLEMNKLWCEDSQRNRTHVQKCLSSISQDKKCSE